MRTQVTVYYTGYCVLHIQRVLTMWFIDTPNEIHCTQQVKLTAKGIWIQNTTALYCIWMFIEMLNILWWSGVIFHKCVLMVVFEGLMFCVWQIFMIL